MVLNSEYPFNYLSFSYSNTGLARSLVNFSALLLLAFGPFSVAWSEIRVTDDAGQEIALQHPARRIISLSPHVTELLFAAGAGRSVVGVSEYSNYPAAAESIPRISGGGGLDMEAIIALQPDLVVAWQSGNPDQQVKRLQSLGMTVFLSEPSRLEDVPATIRKLGKLAATRTPAFEQAAAYEQRLAGLLKRYSQRPQVSVFYQIWENPLMTLNGEHMLSDVMRACGGRNVFAELPALAPQIDVEAVLVANPDVIVVAADAGDNSMLESWRRWPELSAVKQNRLYSIQRELLVRHTPRMLDGVERLCEILEEVRGKK
jgi:iron complex transport system substrate-binding protein